MTKWLATTFSLQNQSEADTIAAIAFKISLKPLKGAIRPNMGSNPKAGMNIGRSSWACEWILNL